MSNPVVQTSPNPAVALNSAGATSIETPAIANVTLAPVVGQQQLPAAFTDQAVINALAAQPHQLQQAPINNHHAPVPNLNHLPNITVQTQNNNHRLEQVSRFLTFLPFEASSESLRGLLHLGISLRAVHRELFN